MAEADKINKEAVKETAVEQIHHHTWRSPLVLTVAGLAVAVIVVGAAVVHHTTNGRIGVMRGFGAPGMMSDGPRHSFRSGFTSNNESRLEGVVTKVDGSTITIAGGGKTNTLTVSSSTQYSGGSSAAVNDTVVATGTTNNGTFTATSVLVNP